MPKVSIVVRAFNEEKHIGDLLKAIKSQRFTDYEIIVVDSGSTDRTREIAVDNCDKFVEISTDDFTFGYSLNIGCRQGKGEFIVNVSAHAIPVSDSWLGSLIAPFSDDQVAMVYGRHIGVEETKFSEKRDFALIFHDNFTKTSTKPFYANNANSAIRRSFWEEQPWDEHLTGLEDIAWSQAMGEKGRSTVYQPEAAVYHIHEETWHQVYNRYRREALAARNFGLSDPPHGSYKFICLLKNLFGDFWASVKMGKLSFDQILKFRYHQWSGSKSGWFHDADLLKERRDIYFSGSNQAVVISKKHRAEYADIPMPEVKPSDVLIKVAYVGVCRTDLEIYDGELGYYQKNIAKFPIVPGHEFSGTVAHVGGNVQNLSIGDAVVAESIISCQKCEPCKQGFSEGCRSRREMGVLNFDGAYSQYFSVPSGCVHLIPKDLDIKVACLVEPLAVVGQGVRRVLACSASPEKKCAVIGAGPIGNLCVQVLAAKGYDVTVFDKNPDRLEYLKNKATCRNDLVGLDDFPIIVEAVGDENILKKVLMESKEGSTLLLLGFPYGEISFNFENLVAHGKTIVGSVGSRSEDFRWALNQLNEIDYEFFIKEVMPLNDFDKAWELHRSGKHLKIILEVDSE
jgi:threonine dehydrogenase-like Zn-dependent dehydrogenase/glycosyltransferase involved in cell wall biosynthesis